MSSCRPRYLALLAFLACFVAGQAGVGVVSDWLDSAPRLAGECLADAEEALGDGKAPEDVAPGLRSLIPSADGCRAPTMDGDSALAARAVFDLLPDSTGPPAA